MARTTVAHATPIHPAFIAAVASLLLLATAACAVVVPVSKPKGPASASVANLGVPPGHLPRPGLCRLWFPGRPPGRQPRAASCSSVMANAPAGAWVLYRPSGDHVHARVIHSQRSGVVVSVRVYASASGVFLRDERP